mmetsp:Transcript_96305/g.281342  ORF Transcript_96305/g.281342 Transcript_96305/m.281342 type:complete len:204 (+) Transcript_96305:141-752(+)
MIPLRIPQLPLQDSTPGAAQRADDRHDRAACALELGPAAGHHVAGALRLLEERLLVGHQQHGPRRHLRGVEAEKLGGLLAAEAHEVRAAVVVRAEADGGLAHEDGLGVGHRILLAVVPLEHLVPQGLRPDNRVVAVAALAHALGRDDVRVQPAHERGHNQGPFSSGPRVHFLPEEFLRQKPEAHYRIGKQLPLAQGLVHPLKN